MPIDYAEYYRALGLDKATLLAEADRFLDTHPDRNIQPQRFHVKKLEHAMDELVMRLVKHGSETVRGLKGLGDANQEITLLTLNAQKAFAKQPTRILSEETSHHTRHSAVAKLKAIGDKSKDNSHLFDEDMVVYRKPLTSITILDARSFKSVPGLGDRFMFEVISYRTIAIQSDNFKNLNTPGDGFVPAKTITERVVDGLARPAFKADVEALLKKHGL